MITVRAKNGGNERQIKGAENYKQKKEDNKNGKKLFKKKSMWIRWERERVNEREKWHLNRSEKCVES